MITVYFVRNGKIPVEVPLVLNLWKLPNFIQRLIPEIPADCGGSCACATCHVHIDEKVGTK